MFLDSTWKPLENLRTLKHENFFNLYFLFKSTELRYSWHTMECIHFTVSSLNFSKCVQLWNCLLNQDIKCFHHPPKVSLVHLQSAPPPLAPGSQWYIFCHFIFALPNLNFHVSRIREFIFFWEPLTCLYLFLFRPITKWTNGRTAFDGWT